MSQESSHTGFHVCVAGLLKNNTLTLYASRRYEILHDSAKWTEIIILLYSGHAISFFGSSHNLIERGL